VQTKKALRRSWRRQAAAPLHAEALRRALKSRLACTARWSHDEAERLAAGNALAVLTEHQWQDSGYLALGVPQPRRDTRPVSRMGGGGR
jgi:hypothetical protein